jgi:hypothetical protein
MRGMGMGCRDRYSERGQSISTVIRSITTYFQDAEIDRVERVESAWTCRGVKVGRQLSKSIITFRPAGVKSVPHGETKVHRRVEWHGLVPHASWISARYLMASQVIIITMA